MNKCLYLYLFVVLVQGHFHVANCPKFFFSHSLKSCHGEDWTIVDEFHLLCENELVVDPLYVKSK